MQKKKAPVGLEVGDTFETPWGDIEITEMREKYNDNPDVVTHREYKIYDPQTEEEAWLQDDDFISVMQSMVFNYE
jgi:hypothetical protein